LQTLGCITQLGRRVYERESCNDLPTYLQDSVVEPMRPWSMPPPRPGRANVISRLPCSHGSLLSLLARCRL
jgi:hypothetical protein